MSGLEMEGGGLGDLPKDDPLPLMRELGMTSVQGQPMPFSVLQPTIADFLNLAWWTSAAAW